MSKAIRASVLKRAYATAAARYAPGEHALFHAFEAYNSGSLNGSARYAAIVWPAEPLQVDVKTGRTS